MRCSAQHASAAAQTPASEGMWCRYVDTDVQSYPKQARPSSSHMRGRVYSVQLLYALEQSYIAPADCPKLSCGIFDALPQASDRSLGSGAGFVYAVL